MSSQQDPWSLVRAKQYAAAAEAYSRRYAEGGGLSALRGRARARLLDGRPAEALQDFRQVIDETEPKLRNDADFLHAGTCHWCLDRPDQAVVAWRESLTAPYTDAAGGVVPPAVLLYAATRLGDQHIEADTLKVLRARWKEHLRRAARRSAATARPAHVDLVHPGLLAWPGPIVPFLLGEIGEQEFDQAAASEAPEILRGRRQCQADFVAGLRVLREGNHDAFRERMSRCALNPHGELEHEFHLARWEVGRGFPMQPFGNIGGPR